MIIDIIIIAVLLVCSFIGAKRGFANSILSFVNKIISLVISIFLAVPFAKILLKTPVATLVQKIVHPLTEIEVPIITIGENMISTLEWWLLVAFAFILLYIASFLIIKLLTAFLDAITSLPVLKQIDSLLGFLLGAVSTLLIIYVLFGILSIFETTTLLTGVFVAIDESYIANFIYNNNFVVNALFTIKPEEIVGQIGELVSK